MTKIMNRCLVSLSIIFMALSLAVAGEIHPGLKNAIDNGDYKMAKNLVEKVGVKDIYCPPSLKVKDAEKVYAQLLAEDPMAILRGNHLSYGFADEYLKVNCNGKKDYNYQICESLYDPIVKGRLKLDSLLGYWLHEKQGICLSKETIKACKYFYDRIDSDSLKMEVLRVLDQKKLLKYTETVEERESGPCVEKKKKDFDRGKCFREAERNYRNAVAECNKRQRHADLCRSGAVQSHTDAERRCENGGTEVVCSSKIVKKKVVVVPFLGDIMSRYREKFKNWEEMDKNWVKEVSLLRKYIDIDEDAVVNNIIRVYKDKGDLDIRDLVGNCKLTPNFDKKVQKKIGFKLFSCKNILSKYSSECDENKDSTKNFETTLNGHNLIMHTCAEGKWHYTRIGEKCGERNKGLVLGTYVCDSVWISVADANLECDEKNDSIKIFKSIGIGGIQKDMTLSCDKNHWRVLRDYENVLGVCNGLKNGKIDSVERWRVVCDKSFWREFSRLENILGVCIEEEKGKVSDKYICDSTWVSIARLDLPKGACEDGSTIQSKYNSEFSYYCDKGSWIASNKDNRFVVDTRDGAYYKFSLIGDQVWMAENLNFEIEHSWCLDNEKYNCDLYGRLYIWAAAMDSAGVFSEGGKGCGSNVKCTPNPPVRGICPEGWHLPTSNEWKTLYATIGNRPYAMQAKGLKKWPDATDAYGFSALPVGYYSKGSFDHVGSSTAFWSATESGNDYADDWSLDADRAHLGNGFKNAGFAVRCVKDE